MSTTTDGRAPGAAPAPEKRGLVDWFVQRLGLSATMEDQYNRIVPKHATNYIYCFGGVAFVLFIILAITGILLAVYYQPTPDMAYQSVLNISTHVQFGWWIRSIHRWSAGGMVLLVFIHTVRVFFTGAYKAPRELNWLTGVALLLITLGFGFTGYLLPWDQKAYWATKVGTDIAGSVPVIGHFLLVTLARRRADQRRHAGPVLRPARPRPAGRHRGAPAGALLDDPPPRHLRTAVRRAMARAKRQVPTNEPPRFYWEIWRDPGQGYIPYFWEELTSQAMIFFLFLGIMGGIALLWPADLAPQANVLVTPSGIKPEWYFLGLFQLIKVIPEIAGIIVPGIVVLLMVILPFVDRSAERNPLRKPVTTTVALIIIIALVVLTIWGAVTP